jgi:hypothetical protein
MDIKVVIASHKDYWIPEDNVYLPVFVGACGRSIKGFFPDDSGENISMLNKSFCELTGLYWAWKNIEYDHLGLVHYRRYFSNRDFTSPKKKRILSGDDLIELLKGTDVLLPKKRHYLIETNYSQYIHAHHKEDIDCLRTVLEQGHPDYLDAFHIVMERRSGHRFNMFIMKKELADGYCHWLFDVLFEVMERLDISGYSDSDRRVFGYLGERMLDIWLYKNKIRYKELPVVFLERQNWIKKIGSFLLRRIRNNG